ncbi:hypothetical protein A2V49_03395 [candidate division WWE3 bacterium RBG_19FT_COMBO_34_6]|uniref:WxL Interacting Protein peptidoglycan binding domain-containing protein n=1 Tax=candidate division WWE3 bacterium RBG_19FT_COMBO_34_6 TaxID=1802612 RepID=A0A1F4UKF9_UNCKA|nr:MAG: hypothetical protein A2V49_03395 [candidate division WWE3 bacterium RBG_19FT_COMBO_34_6]
MSRKNITKILTGAIFTSAILFASFLLSHKLKAQTTGGFNIELSPGKVNLSVDPGKSYVQKFSIGNYSGAKRTLYIFMQDFTVFNETGTPTFFENKNTQNEDLAKFSLSQWVKLPTDKIELENNEVKEVEATITIPENAEAGGHYGAFFVQTESPENQGTAIASIGRLVSLMLVNVPGDVKEDIRITKAYTDKQIYFNDNPQVELITYLKNEGSVHGIPLGAFYVGGGYGGKNRSFIYNQDQGAVLPGAPERKLSQSFTLEKAGAIVPPIGKFTIDLVARYGSKNFPIETTIIFWLLPIKFIAAASLTIIIGAFILWRALVSFKK